MKTNTLDFDAQALREKILDLAMRGKLVPQDPNDEPASVLLEKIKAEKEQLIKEKKIKKSKPLAPITDEEKPFDIPDSWEWVRLGDVSEIVMGQSPKGSTVNQNNEGIEFHQGKTEFTEKIIGKSEKYTTTLNKVIDSDYIVMAVRAPVGDVNLLDRKIAIGRGLAGIDSYLNDKEYIYYYLNGIKDYYDQRATGSTFKAINGAIIKDTPVPLPPLLEQSRIAAKIAQLFALLRKVESSTQQYAKLQTLLKSKVLDLAMRGKLVKQDPHDEPASVLLEKIKAEKEQLVKEGKIKKSKPLPPITDDEKPFDIPDSWEWVRGVDITDTIGDGLHGTPKFSSYGIPFINGSNLKNDKITITSSTKYVSVSEFNKYKKALRPGTLFISLNGTLGKIAKYNGEKIVLGKSAGFFSLLNAKMQNYIAYYLKSTIFINYYNIKYTGSVIKNIPLKALRECLIPLPPLAEQRKIVTKLSLLFNILDF